MALAIDALVRDYRITYPLEERPEGALYRATDQRDGRRVLLATLPLPDAAQLDNALLLASQIATVQSSGLQPLRDYFMEGGTLLLVTDDPGGQEFERTLRDRGTLIGESAALELAERLLGALDLLHAYKPPLLLGDVRATDIWSTTDGSLVWLPFALLRTIGHEHAPYCAPELLEPGHEPTTSSDIYTVGALLYQILTGWAPPSAQQRLAGTPLNAPRLLNPQLSALSEQMLLRALELRAVNRYQGVREMRRALDMVRLIGDRPLGAVAPVVSGAPGPPPPLPPAYPPTLPPAYPELPGYPGQPGPLPGAGTGSPLGGAPPAYPAPGAPTYPGNGPPEAQLAAQQSQTCLIIVVAVLALMALAICAIGAFIAYQMVAGTGSSIVLPPRATLVASATLVPTRGTSATVVAPTEQAAVPTVAAPFPTNEPRPTAQPDAISIASVMAITTTRQITESQVGPVTFTPDGATLAVGFGTAINLYQASDMTRILVLEGHTGVVNALAVASVADGRVLLASGALDEPAIRIWDLSQGQSVAILNGHTGWIRSLAFSPDGSLLASGSTDMSVKLWDTQTWQVVRTLEGHTDYLGNIAFSPDGKQLATASRDGSVRLWDVASGTPLSGFSFETPLDTQTATPFWATGLAFSPDGTALAIGCTNNNTYVVEAPTGKAIRTLRGHNDWVVIRGVSYSPDGKTLATASLDGTIRLWDTTSGVERAQLIKHGLQLLSIAWSPNGQQLAASSDYGGEVAIWDVATENVVQSVRLGQGLVTALNFSRNGDVLGTGGINGLMRLHMLDQGHDLTVTGGSPTFEYLDFLDETTMAAVTDNGTITLLDLARRRQPETLAGQGRTFHNLKVSEDGTLLAAGGDDGSITVWDTQSLQIRQTLKGLDGDVYHLAISSDNRFIAASSNAGKPVIAIWDVKSGQLTVTITDHTDSITALALQPGGGLLASTARDGTLRLWDIRTGTAIRTITASANQGWYNSVAFSPDGSLLLSGGLDSHVEFWDPGTGDRLNSINLDSGTILAMTFQAKGKLLAVSTRDGGVWLLKKE